MKKLSDLLNKNPFTDSIEEPNSVSITINFGKPADRVDVFQGSNFHVDFIEKVITVIKPTPLKDIYSRIQDILDTPVMLTYNNPILAITGQYFELLDGWRFKDDASRHNVQMASWKEGDDVWVSIVPLGCFGENIELYYGWSENFTTTPFVNMTSLTEKDSGRISEAIKVRKDEKLYINMSGPSIYDNVTELTGIDNLSTLNGIIYVPVCWHKGLP